MRFILSIVIVAIILSFIPIIASKIKMYSAKESSKNTASPFKSDREKLDE